MVPFTPDVIPADAYLARCRKQQAADQFDGRGFASAVRTQESKELSRLDPQAEIVDRNLGPKSLGDLDQFNTGGVYGLLHIRIERLRLLENLVGLARVIHEQNLFRVHVSGSAGRCRPKLPVATRSHRSAVPTSGPWNRRRRSRSRNM